MPVKINTLEVENVKRIRALQLAPAENGLTLIGGNNNQGKTSVLDSICWLFGGKKFEPTNAKREGALMEPMLRARLSNGLIVERKGKNAALKVIDSQGNRSGQALLDSFISELALNLPKFMQASDKEKADTLLQIIGVGEQLTQMEQEEKRLYDQRTAIGQIAQQKAKYAAELVRWDNIPDTPISASELILQQQEILARNGENQRKRLHLAQLTAKKNQLSERIAMLRQQLQDIMKEYEQVVADEETAMKTVAELQDASTAELEASIAGIDKINVKIRDNMNKAAAEAEAKGYADQYEELTDRIEAIRKAKRDLLLGADLPLPGLSVEQGKLLFGGKAWDCMSGSEQLRVATAIVRKLNPNCGFVLLDKLEQMDMQTLAEFGAWLEAEGLQAIATRVSTGDECSIIIEDGLAVPNEPPAKPMAGYVPGWKKGE
ncbi:MAG: AAA family ATPase [Oscillospiraceae bacterium]|nr:AAA family ATPase [Oscillospiraceae bacterium]